MGSLFSQPRVVKKVPVRIYVHEINRRAIGREILRRCGNEGRHGYLGQTTATTLKFLETAAAFIPQAEEAGADMCNAAFILWQRNGEKFAIIAGDGDWEFEFSEDRNGDINGRCVRKVWYRYYWDKFTSVVRPILKLGARVGCYFLGTAIGGPLGFLTAGAVQLAIEAAL